MAGSLLESLLPTDEEVSLAAAGGQDKVSETSEERLDADLDLFDSSDAPPPSVPTAGRVDPVFDQSISFAPRGNQLFGDKVPPTPPTAFVHTPLVSVQTAAQVKGGSRPTAPKARVSVPPPAVRSGTVTGQVPGVTAVPTVPSGNTGVLQVTSLGQQQEGAGRVKSRSKSKKKKATPPSSSSSSSESESSSCSEASTASKHVQFQDSVWPLVPYAADVNPYTRGCGVRAVAPCFFKPTSFDGYNVCAAQRFVSAASLCEVEVLVSALSFLVDWQEWAALVANDCGQRDDKLYGFVQQSFQHFEGVRIYLRLGMVRCGLD